MCVGSSKWENVTRDTGDVRRATADGNAGFPLSPLFWQGIPLLFPLCFVTIQRRIKKHTNTVRGYPCTGRLRTNAARTR
jgi:hypothetical protein